MILTAKDKSEAYRAAGYWGDRQLHDLFYENAERNPEAIALVDPINKPDLIAQPAHSLSYAKAKERVDQLCEAFLYIGIKADDIILVQMPNTVELVWTYLAASQLGAIISPVAMQYQENELIDIVRILKPAAIMGCATFKKSSGMLPLLNSVTELHKELPRTPKFLCWGWHDQCHNLYDLMASCSSNKRLSQHVAQHPTSGDDVLTICWTSGTEGKPKGIPRSHNQWLTVGLATYEGNHIQAGESLLNPFPFINMASIGGLFMSWLYSGGKLVLHHPLDLPVFLQQLVEEEISYTLAPPVLLNTLLKNEELLKQCDFSKLRAIGSGSAPLDSWMVKGFKDRFDIEVVNHFGSNEGVCLLCGPSETDSAETRARLFPMQHDNLECRLVDTDTGTEVTETGKAAELQIKGPTVFDGYYQADDKTQAAFTDDGYFRTGDLFEISSDNPDFYRFTGRCKDLIIRGGMNISPAEIDTLISAHERVTEAAVAGYPCETMGERIAAFIVTNDNEPISLNDIVSYLRSCKVAAFKLPEKVIQIEAIPRNPLGKVMRSQLSDMLRSAHPTATQH